MAKSDTLFIAIGGGELSKADSVLEGFLESVKKKRDPRILVMTVATNDPDQASNKYNSIFRNRGIKHVDTVDVSQREDAYDSRAVKKAEQTDAFFFTGGDQLNITTLLGGSPLGQMVQQRVNEGVIVAGTSAGAAMMPKTMIISGDSVKPPTMGGVEIALPYRGKGERVGITGVKVDVLPEGYGFDLNERRAISPPLKKIRVAGDEQ